MIFYFFDCFILLPRNRSLFQAHEILFLAHEIRFLAHEIVFRALEIVIRATKYSFVPTKYSNKNTYKMYILGSRPNVVRKIL